MTTNFWITILVSLVTVVLTTVVKIEMKYAPDRATAYRGLRALLLKVLSFTALGWCLFSLTLELITKAPVTRLGIFKIAAYTSVIGVWICLALIERLFKMIDRMASYNKIMGKLAMEHVDVTKDTVSLLRRVVERSSHKTPKKLPQESPTRDP